MIHGLSQACQARGHTASRQWIDDIRRYDMIIDIWFPVVRFEVEVLSSSQQAAS